MKILLIGGSGLLGKELLKLNNSVLSPNHRELNIRNIDKVSTYLTKNKPDIIINCAAILNNNIIENNPEEVIYTNIVGTANLAILCCVLKIRLVYVSSDYVYPGETGNYKEDDPILPFNFYAWTKLGGECALKGVRNHLIIRTSFGASKFPYKEAFSDRWRSKDYVDIIAPMIYEASLSDLQGIINIGTDRKSMFSYAKARNPNVKSVLLKDTNFNAPWDTSFNLDRWNNFKNQ